MLDPVEQVLAAEIGENCCIGEVFISRTPAGGFILCHRDDEPKTVAEVFHGAEAAAEIAKHDDAGNYRPLKTAPTLRHGWRDFRDRIESRPQHGRGRPSYSAPRNSARRSIAGAGHGGDPARNV